MLRDKGFVVKSDAIGPMSASRWGTDVFLIAPTTVRDMTWEDLLAEVLPAAPVAVIMDHTVHGSVDSFIRAGVTGVLDRCAQVDVVVEGLRAVAGGRRFIGASNDTSADGGHDGAVPGVRADEANPLSPRELQVITQIARGLTHRQGARALGISQHTFDTHIKRIRSKLGVGNKAELTRAVVMRDFRRAS
ncbi:LuxR C-terminal-related transcriptional regulator [Nonomuraea sp. NPDC050786]|uniref:response regulator transcription factor n=1 Tax=Nonomuraea sp. NPDC050786 TaxID=3154840 RepID=UPI0033F0DDE3